MTAPFALATVLKRDRAMVLVGLLGVAALAWLYLVDLTLGMGDMPKAVGEAVTTARTAPWSGLDLALMFVMWAVMMVGMMLPGAAPMILLFAAVNRKKREQAKPFVPTAIFALGYLAVWTAFSGLATGLQWGLQRAALVSPSMESTGAVLGGLIFFAAGIYQWTPLKHACLRKCQSPIGFLARRWREGPRGALAMGLEHGAYCVGCCWVLMALLFAGGVMNLAWVALLALFVMVEKLAPRGPWPPRIAGALLSAWGMVVLTAGL